MIDFLLPSISAKHPGFVRVLLSCIVSTMSLSKRVCCCGGTECSFLLSVSVVCGVSTVVPSRFVRFCSQSTLYSLFVGLASSSSECVSSDCTASCSKLPVVGAEDIYILVSNHLGRPVTALVSAGGQSSRESGQRCPMDTTLADVLEFVGKSTSVKFVIEPLEH